MKAGAERKLIPVACTLTNDDAATRVDEIRRLLAHSLTGVDHRERVLSLRFRPDDAVERDVRDLAARERECCGFLDLQVSRTAAAVILSIGAPVGAEVVLEGWAEAATNALTTR